MESKSGPLRRLLRFALDLVVGFVVLLDELARPLYRPLIRWVAGLRIMALMEAQVARLPPYGILALLAVPFAIAEPMKLIALVVIAHGSWLAGGLMLAFAYLASFVLVERLYHAGRHKLLTIGWFARVMAFITGIRDAVLARLRATAFWQRAAELGRRLRARAAGIVAAIRAWLRARLA